MVSSSMSCLWAFIDESGDLGFGQGSSRYVTFAAVITSSLSAVERIPRRIRRRRLKKSLRRIPELKFHNSSHEVRTAVLRMLAASADVRVACLVADKRSAKDRFSGRMDQLYLESCLRMANEVARLVGPRGTLNLTFDARRGGGIVDSGFGSRILENMTGRAVGMKNMPASARVSKLDSVNSGGLQVADYVAGAIQRRYERGDLRYYRIIAPLIEAELDWSAL